MICSLTLGELVRRKIMAFGVFGEEIASERHIGWFGQHLDTLFFPIFVGGIHILDSKAEFDAAGMLFLRGREWSRFLVLQADDCPTIRRTERGKNVGRTRPYISHAQ